jgi:hypothetical protein
MEALEVEVGIIEDPASEAKEALRRHQEAMGIHFDNPDEPVAAQPGSGRDEYLP